MNLENLYVMINGRCEKTNNFKHMKVLWTIHNNIIVYNINSKNPLIKYINLKLRET